MHYTVCLIYVLYSTIADNISYHFFIAVQVDQILYITNVYGGWMIRVLWNLF